MQIIASPDPGISTELVEADDFKHFSVVVHAHADAETLRRAVGALGRSDGDSFVFVDPNALVRLPGALAHDPEWHTSLDGMLEFARSKGWVDASGMVRAHVQWTG
jgi:hypothetical protein